MRLLSERLIQSGEAEPSQATVRVAARQMRQPNPQ